MDIQYQIIKTKSINDDNYIDVCFINGVVKTQLYKKIEQPNIFNMVKEFEGDDIEKMEEEFKNE